MPLFAATAVALVALASPAAVRAQAVNPSAAAILKSDADFAASVAAKDRERFLAFIAEVTTFNGGTAGEIHGRDAVMKEWEPFFQAGGPTLTWAPTRGEMIGAGDVGYTIGSSVFRQRAADGAVTERRGEYLTAWRRQADGSWKAVFDTGSTLR